jgi:hypothetical protein
LKEAIQDAYRKRKTEMMQYSGILNEIKQKTVKSAGDWQENDSIRKGWRKLSVKEEKSKESKEKEEYLTTELLV